MTERLEHLERRFPSLSSIGYKPKSAQSLDYNCVAYAAGDETRVWQPSPVGGYWPPEADRGFGIEHLVSAFEQEGFMLCDGDALEPGFERVALYANDQGRWQQA